MTPRVLFVCTENANRSQMAEAFARRHGAGLIEARSAGSRPSGRVNPRAIEAMRELGYDLTSHRSGSIEEAGPEPWDYVVTLCEDDCPWVAARQRESWALPDPRDLPPAEFRAVRDEIDRRVRDLIDRIRSSTASDRP